MKEELDDRTIDAIAQRMTGAALSDGFHSRVLERLDERRRPWRWFLEIAPAPMLIGATLVTLIATASTLWILRSPLAREAPLASAPPVTAPVLAQPALTTAWPSQAAHEPFVPARVTTVATAAAELPPEPEMSASEQAWLDRAIPALAPPDAVAVASIQPTGVDIPLLEMRPLAQERLTLLPLGSGPGR